MRVPSRVTGRVPFPSEPQRYLQDYSTPEAFGAGVGRGLAAFGAGLSRLAAQYEDSQAELQERQEKTERFRALRGLSEFQDKANQRLLELKRSMPADGGDYVTLAEKEYAKLEQEYLDSINPALRDEFSVRTTDMRNPVFADALKFKYEAQDANFRVGINDTYTRAQTALDPRQGGVPTKDNLARQTALVLEQIEASDLSVGEKTLLARQMTDGLKSVTYRAEIVQQKVAGGGYTLNEGIQGVINQAAEKYGVPAEALTAIAWIESKGNPNAKNLSSSAGGLFQQIDRNAKQYGVKNRFDPAQSADGAARFMRDNMAVLRRALGREPTTGELYLAHQQGPQGAVNLLTNPNALAVDIVGYRAVRLNGGGPGMTAQQFANLWIRKAEGAVGTAKIDSDPIYDSIPYETRLALQKDAEGDANKILSEQKAASAAAYEGFINNLMNGIQDGGVGRADVDKLYEDGRLTKYEDRIRAIKAIEARDAELLEQQRAFDKYDRGVIFGLDGDDKKDLNRIYNANNLLPSAVDQADPSAVTHGLIPILRRTKAIPSDAVDDLAGMMRSQDMKKFLFAADAFSQLEQENQRAYAAQVSEDVRKDVDLWRSIKDMMKPEDVFAWMNDADPSVTQAKKQRRDEAKQLLSSLQDGLPRLQTLTNTILDEAVTFGSGEVAPGFMRMALEREVQNHFIYYYTNMPRTDLTAIEQNVKKRINETWGVAEVGESMYMKYPPQLAGYSPLDESFDWIDRQVRKELPEVTGKYWLYSDGQTENEIKGIQAGARDVSLPPAARKGAGANMPSYQVIKINEFGQGELVMNPDTNKPYRLAFKPEPEDIQAEVERIDFLNEEDLLNRRFQEIIEMGQRAQSAGKEIPQEVWDEQKRIEQEYNELVERRKQRRRERFLQPEKTFEELERRLGTDLPIPQPFGGR